MTRFPLHEPLSVEEALARLPHYPNKIAAFLADLDIQTAPAAPDKFRDVCAVCPIAQYLQEVCDDSRIRVTLMYVQQWAKNDVRLPEYVTNFIIDFDRGAFPFLIEGWRWPGED